MLYPDGPSRAPAVSQVYTPLLDTLAALGAAGGPGCTKPPPASDGVESRNFSASPSGSEPGTWKVHRLSLGQFTIGGKPLTGELFAPPTLTKVCTR